MSRTIYKYQVIKAFEINKNLVLPEDIVYVSEEYRYEGRPIYAKNVYNEKRQFLGIHFRESDPNFESKIKSI